MIRLILYKILPLSAYLQVLSKLFFFSFRNGSLRSKEEYKYYYFLNTRIKPGSIIIDIGANLGYFSRLFAEWTGPGGQVHAVEPVKEMRTQLTRNTQNLQQVTIYPFALGKEEKSILLGNDSRRMLGYMASGRHSVLKEGEDAIDTFPAEMKRGSVLFRDLTRIDLIKCDVEGHEYPILEDMRELIDVHKPDILLESSGVSRTKCFELLTSLGYRCFRLEGDELEPMSQPDERQDDLFYSHPSRKGLS
jgi:FkbM family methyltransferase